MSTEVCDGIKKTQDLINSINSYPNGERILDGLLRHRGKKGVSEETLQGILNMLTSIKQPKE